MDAMSPFARALGNSAVNPYCSIDPVAGTAEPLPHFGDVEADGSHGAICECEAGQQSRCPVIEVLSPDTERASDL